MDKIIYFFIKLLDYPEWLSFVAILAPIAWTLIYYIIYCPCKKKRCNKILQRPEKYNIGCIYKAIDWLTYHEWTKDFDRIWTTSNNKS